MEELLNKLIEKGWKPRNIECTGVKSTDYCLEFYTKAIGWISKNERQLVSKESGLWQFVCENGMVEDKGEIRYKADENNDIDDANYMSEFYYWLLETSLKDESELEQFLLDNIKIDG